MPVATALWKSIDGEMKLRCACAFDSSFSMLVIVESKRPSRAVFPFDIYSCGVLLIFLPHKREQIVS